MFFSQRFKSIAFLILAVTVPAWAQDPTEDELPPAERVTINSIKQIPDPPKNDKLASSLSRAAESFELRGSDWRDGVNTAEFLEEDDRILVEIRCDSKDENRMIEDFNTKGMRVRNHNVPGLVEAWLPVSELRGLEKDSAVHYIRPARTVIPLIGSVDTEELMLSNADLWHAVGIDGTGVTLGNIDGGYIGYVARQGTNDWPSGAQLTTHDLNGAPFGTGTDHGTNTVEINYDMAPGADFHVYETTTISDWYAALIQSIADGVDIVSVSLGAPLDGVGDGSECPPNFTPPCGTIAEASGIARAAGVLVVNAAGNERESHWGGLYSDAAGNPGFHDWGSGSAFLQSSACVPAGATLVITLHWDDWTAVNHDYDLRLYRLAPGPTAQLVAQSTNPQNGGPGQTPEEFIVFGASGTSPGCPANFSNYLFVVRRVNAPTNRNLQLFPGLPLFDPVFPRSLGFPGDSPNVLTVAAVDVNTTIQEDYSSEGPVLGPGGSLAPSAIQKPDLSSVANVATATPGPPFNGTSAATPHVAGMAAMLKQLMPFLTVDELADELRQIASQNDLGPAGFDTMFGHGLLRFAGGPPLLLEGFTFFDAGMTNPVNTVSVEVFNLDQGTSFQADTQNNHYRLLLDIGSEVASGETLRIIAKDGTNFINVTDHVVTAGEIAAAYIPLDLVLDEYYLDAVDFPYYEADAPNFNQNAGPAVAQMLLNYIHWNSTIDPTPPLTFTQAFLYGYGQPLNETPGLSVLDTLGMWRTIQDNRPLPYAQFGYNFSIRHDVDGNEMLKQISQWLSYTIGTFGGLEPGHPDHVPGVIPAYGDYSNWMVVRGIHTNEVAYPLPATLQVYGFWINDPFPAVMGGIGENSYKTASEILATYYFPLATGDSYDGEYVAICEPPTKNKDKQVVLADSRNRFSQSDKDLIDQLRQSDNPPGSLVAEVNRRISGAARTAANEELSPYDDGFRQRLAESSAGDVFFVRSEVGADYYIAPFLDGETSVVVLVDEAEGAFREASWVEHSVAYPPVSESRAIYLVQKEMGSLGLDANDWRDAVMELVHFDGNPYFPDWRIDIQNVVFGVGQDGAVEILEDNRK